MSKVITIDNVARLEGHASVTLYLDKDGGVEKAEYLATEPSRGFDIIFKGKHASEVPMLAARICGICYTAHNICACKALEDAWETPIPDSAKKIRELLLFANTLASHALHTFFLAGPGLLIEGANTIADLQKKYPDFPEAGIELRMIGQQISEIIAGRKVHTTIAVPGGVLGVLEQEKQDNIMKLLDSASEPIEIMEDYSHRILSDRKDYMLSFGMIETHFLALKQSKRLELYDNPIELLMKNGKVDILTPTQILERITEEKKDYSYVRHPYITDLGSDNGQFRTGALARIQEDASWDNPTFHEFKKIFGTFTQSTMGYDIARVAEMVECIKGMKNIIKSGLDKDIKNVAHQKDGIGVAVVEAPRGLLLHQYEIDSEGIVRKARVIAPTTFHQGSIERSTFEAAKIVLNGKKGKCSDEEKIKIEQAIRAYDPCMSCAGATQLRVIKKPI
ncbi:Ni/Fe hydrogenase subunit alpha [candidate division WOR-3 bacterium]|nr:Ni/Fe hydrogenase subunit alpha [candidate division WOR-3 bacterium]